MNWLIDRSVGRRSVDIRSSLLHTISSILPNQSTFARSYISNPRQSSFFWSFGPFPSTRFHWVQVCWSFFPLLISSATELPTFKSKILRFSNTLLHRSHQFLSLSPFKSTFSLPQSVCFMPKNLHFHSFLPSISSLFTKLLCYFPTGPA